MSSDVFKKYAAATVIGCTLGTLTANLLVLPMKSKLESAEQKLDPHAGRQALQDALKKGMEDALKKGADLYLSAEPAKKLITLATLPSRYQKRLIQIEDDLLHCRINETLHKELVQALITSRCLHAALPKDQVPQTVVVHAVYKILEESDRALSGARKESFDGGYGYSQTAEISQREMRGELASLQSALSKLEKIASK